MIRKLKHIISVFLLLVFLVPSFAKLDHYHKNIINKSKDEKHNQVFHENCGICNFEFSIFVSYTLDPGLQNESPLDSYTINYNSREFSDICQLSFSLRAPPLKQI